MSPEEIHAAVGRYDCHFIEITGGEPLEQDDCFSLMEDLCERGYTVAVETGGHLDISLVDPRVIRILDVKCPASGMTRRNRYENLDILSKRDEVKFVIADEGDYLWAREILRRHDIPKRCATVLFAPVYGLLSPALLAAWMLRDHLPVRLQLQIHKYIWDPGRKGV